MDLKGDFSVEEFIIGKRKEDHSYARLIIRGDSESHLQRILENLYREGATSISTSNFNCEKAPKDMVLPDDFYSTTNNATQLFYNNQWISVDRMMMDKCIVFDPINKRAECKTKRDVRKGDLVVTGEKELELSLRKDQERESIYFSS
jgi:hypothetical protein